jgi:hypothetical protein
MIHDIDGQFGEVMNPTISKKVYLVGLDNARSTGAF